MRTKKRGSQKPTPHHPQKQHSRSPSLITPSQSRNFSFYDTGSAVSTPKPRGTRPQPKAKTSGGNQDRYEMLKNTRGSSQSRPPSPQQQQDHPRTLTKEERLQEQKSPEERKRAEANPNDFDSVFKNSRLSPVFASNPTHKSFWTRMGDGDTVYLVGNRRLVDPHGSTQDNTFCLLQRTIDQDLNQIHDRLVAMDYESGMPFEQYLTTTLDGDLSNGTALDKDQETGTIISRTFLRLRGEPWQWHSGVAMSKIEPRVPASVSQEYLDSLPDTFAISRIKFSENGILAEKLIKQNNKIVLTIVDDLKITTKQQFDQKAEKVFSDYSKLLSEQLEKNAENFDPDNMMGKGGSGGGMDDGMGGGMGGGGAGGQRFDPSMFQGGVGLGPKH